ncbi:MAG: class I SAM-dependent methyltransferase [Bacillus sp. (in: firmicutes)]
MIVTTAGRPDEMIIRTAQETAERLKLPFVFRQKKSLSHFLSQHKQVLVVGKEGILAYDQHAKNPYFFHPNLAMVRVKRLKAGLNDAFIDTAGLRPGDSLLDCTLGYASDSIVASFVVGQSGRVTGIEASPLLAYMTELGLQSWYGTDEEMRQAMKRVKVRATDHLSYLRSLADDSYDVVYFDPMFEESITESDAMQALASFTVYSGLSQEVIEEARRVARKKIVLKDHFRSQRFSALGFTQHIRKTSKFHFGTIDKKQDA